MAFSVIQEIYKLDPQGEFSPNLGQWYDRS